MRRDRAEIWSSLKSPIWAQEQLAANLGLPLSAVTVHVTQGGGSFGRHLFFDAAFEAAAISKTIGKPVKLMWHRTDDFRHGRVHPMCTSRVRVTYTPDNVLAFDQRHTSVATDFSMGLGELLTAMVATLPGGNSLGYSQTIFALTQNVPYNFGAVTQLLNEVYAYDTFHTGSVRNIYSPNVSTATELMVDQLAKRAREGPVRVPPRVRPRRPHAGGARQGRRSRRLGPRDGARAPRRASRSTASTRAAARAWSRSTAGPRPSTARSTTATPARASPRRCSSSTSACRSTRSASRRR